MNSRDPKGDLFQTGMGISQSRSWISSLIAQFRDWMEERRNPTERVKITAASDPTALNKFVESQSLIVAVPMAVAGFFGDLFRPHKIETTVAPVAVEEIWSKHSKTMPMLSSMLLYGGAITLLWIPFGTAPKLPEATETMVALVAPQPLKLDLPKDTGGGGGGKKQPTPPSLGVLPRAADKQFVPPDPEPPKNLHPILPMEMTIVAPNVQQAPMVSLFNIGDPTGIPGPPSSGPGTGGGIGTGDGRGVGEGLGPGAGPGSGGGINNVGRVLKLTGDMVQPKCTSVQPEYSDEARKVRLQGKVVVEAVVNPDGTVQATKVVRGLGMGLDDNAVAATRKFKCSPAMRDGKPLAVSVNLEFNFRLF